jgi:hypothetical protein
LAAARQRWGFVGALVAVRQQGFCRLALGWACWQGGVVGLMACHGIGAGVLVSEGEGPDNQHEVEGGRGEGGGESCHVF